MQAASPNQSAAARALPSEFARGISYAHDWSSHGAAGYGSESDRAQLDRLRSLGVTWLSLMPFAYVPTQTPPTIVANYVRRGSESDDAMRLTITAAHQRSMKVLIKPHLWVPRSWPGALGSSAADATEWTAQWHDIVLHYADFAEQTQSEAFCIGTEMDGIASRAEPAWRSLIAEVRQRYHGQLAYCGNWNSVQTIAFFDALDVIGVQDYAPRATTATTEVSTLSTEQLQARTSTILRNYAALSERFHKPIWLTEVGFRCDRDALVEPWRWSDQSLQQCDCELQSIAYNSTLQSISEIPAIQGVFVWKWFTSGGLEEEGRCGFAIHHQQTLSTFRRWFTQPPG